jgi:hypothetical protein
MRRKKYLYDLIIIVLFITTILFVQFYIPQSAISLSKKIDQTTAGDFDDQRLDLSGEYEKYLSKFLPADDQIPSIGHHFIGNQRKLLDLRVKKAIAKIETTNLGKNEIRVWSLLNMGVVVKTNDKIIAIDIANIPYLSTAHNELSEIVDLFLVTHDDADHFDKKLLEQALKNNKKVVFLEDFYFDTDNSQIVNILKLKSGVITDVDSIKLTAFKTDHRGDGNFKEPSAWFLVETNNFTILHTGDGLAFQNPNEIQNLRDRKDVDLMLANLMLSRENIEEISPKVHLPLHLFKYLHSREKLSESTFQAAISKYKSEKYSTSEMKMLFAGESFLYSRTMN